eukprot:2652797-Pleurochrysis_carterae.AAC.2
MHRILSGVCSARDQRLILRLLASKFALIEQATKSPDAIAYGVLSQCGLRCSLCFIVEMLTRQAQLSCSLLRKTFENSWDRDLSVISLSVLFTSTS